MSNDREIRHRVVVSATEELAFEAVTKASDLREWFSDEAGTEFRPGGRWEVHWNQGYRAEGRFTELDPPHRSGLIVRPRPHP